MSPKDIQLTVESMASMVHLLLAHELQDRSFVVGMEAGGVRDHEAIDNYSAALAALSGMVHSPLENTVTGVEPEPVDPMRTACLAVEAVIGAWRTESPGFRKWWLDLGGMGIGHAHDEAAHAVRDALAADGVPAADPVDLGKSESAADINSLFDEQIAGECQEMPEVSISLVPDCTGWWWWNGYECEPVHVTDPIGDGLQFGMNPLLVADVDPRHWRGRCVRSSDTQTPADVLHLRDSLTDSRARVAKLEGDLRGLEGQRDRLREQDKATGVEQAKFTTHLQRRNDNQSDLIDSLRAQLPPSSEEPKRLVPRRVVGKTLGEVIREQRESVGMSLRDLCLKSGYGESFLGHIEDGTRDPPAGVLASVFRALDVEDESGD